MKRTLIVGLILAQACAWAVAESPKQLDAAGLLALQLPDVKITSVKHEDAGYFDVDGVIGGAIQFEVLLPDTWNGRFAMGGGGGFVGSVQNPARDSFSKGYATAGTDTGHQASGTVARWALDDVLAQVNFAHLAVHRTAEVSKAIIHAYYGKRPEFSYFLGCSRGGGQAMVESQRYPEDFDGIVAGAPAFNWNGIAALFVRVAQAMYPDPKTLNAPVVPMKILGGVYDELMRQCDKQDGLEDGIIADPRDVHFDVSKVPGIAPEQQAAIEAVYAGVSNADGPIYPGFSYGAEKDPGGWFGWISGPVPPLLKDQNAPTATFAFGTELFKYFVFNDPDWDYSTYDFSTWAKDTRLAASMLNATNTDLSTFKARNGKLILWHGWGDPALPPLATVDYYEKVLAHDPAAADYVRLFMISGCLHCAGGPGPSNVDWLAAIAEWVEQGKAPGLLIATGKMRDGVAEERPLYPYPAEAAYKGEGNPFDADSFTPKTP
ncbi:MAG: tannase/feruloyl esterase family alpha/beta hydrolase [Candidatus Hydrogenedentes bacterium]|nr:tannase/feruloyl esterase family alpha/beta hydrolase [Candidatus Hydrogenedentota bacterium]